MVTKYFKSTRLVALCLYLVTREPISETWKANFQITVRNERNYVMRNIRTAVLCD
jgi:hypothetical protein